QARLQARFGRSWRRKAPVESLMPLRLAKYGVSLAETAPAGLAAAGIEPALLPPAPAPALPQVPVPVPQQRQSPALEAPAPQEMELAQLRTGEPKPSSQASSSAPVQPPEPAQDDADARAGGRLADAYQAWLATYASEPTSEQFALWLQERYGIATASGAPLSDEQLQPLLQVLKQHAEPAPEVESSLDVPQDAPDEETWADYFYNAWHTCAEERGTPPDAAALAEYVYQRDGIMGATGQPVTADELREYVARFQAQDHGDDGTESVPPAENQPDIRVHEQAETQSLQGQGQGQELAAAGAQAAKKQRSPRIDARIESDDQPSPPDPAESPGLTVVDRYYLAWSEYQDQHGSEPAADELSAVLAQKGMLGRGGKPVSVSTLRRYPLQFRIYNVWAEHRVRTDVPSADAVAQDCAARGITAQYNKPIPAEQIDEQTDDFERRWNVFTRHHAESR
ncbi:hypothetical protein ACIOJ9_38810, partial [Streptomyces sp. NPDC088175]